ncbi:uncharacterized protein TNCV_3800411 [Trichonephila clavipes]|nr:uncharacterized protein TNCV_3800411 [Trichonephila clavipes]
MGSCLRKLKALWGEKKLSDGKTIGGKGRLTDAIISKLTTFYDNAIRANSHNVNEMRQAVWALWAHTSSTDDKPKHWFCPKGKNSWCKYNVSVHNNTVNEFSHTLPKAVSEVIKPVFKDLSHLKLLRRCLGEKTQSANESLNSLIWKYNLKLIGSGINVAKIAAFIAACENNGGSVKFAQILRPSDNANENFIMTISDDSPKFDIGPNVSQHNRAEVEQLLSTYTPKKTVNIELYIALTYDEPIFHNPRRFPFAERDIVDAQVNEWVENGIVEHVVVVKKKVVVVKKKDVKLW